MDRNTWIGFLLIAGIFVVFALMERPSEEEMRERRRVRDSIAVVERMEREAEELSERISEASFRGGDVGGRGLSDSLSAVYSEFACSALGRDSVIILEGSRVRVYVTTRGGYICGVELKEYRSYGDSVHPLRLFGSGEGQMYFSLVTLSGRIVSTRDLYFEPVLHSDSVLVMRLRTGIEGSYIDYRYTMMPDGYMVGFGISGSGLSRVLASNVRSLEMGWWQLVPQQERGRKFEERYSQLEYMLVGGDIEKLSEQKEDQGKETSKVKWVAYKDQFFSSVLVASDGFGSSFFESRPFGKQERYIKEYKMSASVDFDVRDPGVFFKFYFGPNHYNTLKAYDRDLEGDARLHLQELVPLGWKVVSWINKLLVIPMFDLFTRWGLHIGVIILLMTLVIKVIILPFVFASYRSSAKMRVLRPQIEAINAKFPMDKMQERQQATMALYRKAGVSPMSGCLPMLFQFPVLMAMFWFFPTAIDLRGKSLFWADDLSTYDAVFTWSGHVPLLGDHLSLFCLLMTVCNFVYTYITMQSQATDPNMKFMKWMMYLMPLMFLFIFNDYAAGLSYYYLLSLFFTIFQTMLFRLFVDDKTLLEQMEANARRRASSKKLGLMERLEKMQREQLQNARRQAKMNMKKQR